MLPLMTESLLDVPSGTGLLLTVKALRVFLATAGDIMVEVDEVVAVSSGFVANKVVSFC